MAVLLSEALRGALTPWSSYLDLLSCLLNLLAICPIDFIRTRQEFPDW